MAVTSGFFNSVNGDRKYSAEQFGSIFDGVIVDGIFYAVGGQFRVVPAGGNTIEVASGRAWFKHIWIYNDAPLRLEAVPADVLTNRIDTVIIEVDTRTQNRRASIRIVEGERASTPRRRAMVRESGVYQYPIVDIYRSAGDTMIEARAITYLGGTGDTPWVTGPLKTIDATDIFDRWDRTMNEQKDAAKNAYDAAVNDMRNQAYGLLNDITGMLGGDALSAMAAQIIELKQRLGDDSSGTVRFDTIEDHFGNSIQDGNGQPILGKIVYRKV